MFVADVVVNYESSLCHRGRSAPLHAIFDKAIIKRMEEWQGNDV